MTSWTLVEATLEAVPAEVRPSSKNNNNSGNRGQGGRGRCNTNLLLPVNFSKMLTTFGFQS